MKEKYRNVCDNQNLLLFLRANPFSVFAGSSLGDPNARNLNSESQSEGEDVSAGHRKH